MGRSIIALLIFALFVSSQCINACSITSCGKPVPVKSSCHHDQASPGGDESSCLHQISGLAEIAAEQSPTLLLQSVVDLRPLSGSHYTPGAERAPSPSGFFEPFSVLRI